MAFWLRAGLVIGAIYYLSPLRFGEAPGAVHPRLAEGPAASSRTVPAPSGLGELAGPVLEALPAPLRARMVEAAAAGAGRALETGLGAAATEAGRPPSRDTLTSHDRQPAWRGAPERETR